jgi:hypothetical protein
VWLGAEKQRAGSPVGAGDGQLEISNTRHPPDDLEHFAGAERRVRGAWHEQSPEFGAMAGALDFG